jgi:hypothetical protein
MAGAVIMFATINITAADAQVHAANEDEQRLLSPFNPVSATAET